MKRRETSHAGVLLRVRGVDDKESGSGLILVVGSMLILAMFALTTLAYTVSSQRFARYDQDYAGAMAAAQSGIEDFISRLNRDDTYGVVVDCANEAWRGPGVTGYDGQPACGWSDTTAPGWLPVVPGDTDPDAARFHYRVNASEKGTFGTVTLTVTGRVNGVYRTVETAVGEGGSTDYVYYTDFESADPANRQAYPLSTISSWSTAKRNACGINGNRWALYWYKGRGPYNCSEITFIGGDVLDGEVFTNDTILGTARFVNGISTKPLFMKQVLTADQDCKAAGATNASWEDACLRDGSVADFNGTKPLYEDPFQLDDTSAAFAGYPGCHYFGSTRIVLQSNGWMKVWNSKTVNNNVAPVSVAPPGGTAPACGSPSDLDSDAGATVPVPQEMVVYVATSSAPLRQCYRDEIGGPSGRTLPLGTFAGLPATNGASYTYDTNMTEDPKACARGNLYVEGTLKGRVTLAAAESIVVTGDLVLAGGMYGPSDMLGLVATNSVEVFHPLMVTVNAVKTKPSCYWNCTYKWGTPSTESEINGWPTRYVDPTTSTKNPADGVQIAASIQTLLHSFLVQKYADGGDAGTLLVNGSIAQRWRGIVGQGSHGYTKLYRYDPRLTYDAPPYFPKWANSEWSLGFSGEINTPSELRTP